MPGPLKGALGLWPWHLLNRKASGERRVPSCQSVLFLLVGTSRSWQGPRGWEGLSAGYAFSPGLGKVDGTGASPARQRQV